MPEPQPISEHCAIGEASTLTGLSPHTIRVWEKRYGFPEAVRLPSGHRRYTRAQVRRLQAAAELVALGHRPGKVLKLSEEAMDSLLQEERQSHQAHDSKEVEKILVAAPPTLRILLDRQVQEHGMRRTVHDFLVPLIQRIGQAWAANEIDIHREHLMSEAIQDVLRSARLQVQRSHVEERPVDLVLATLPGEHHGLGLQMLSLLAVLNDSNPLLLGIDLPIREMVEAVSEHAGAALALSVSSASDVTTTTKQLRRLREELPDHVELLVGGDGVPKRVAIPGVQKLLDLHAFEAWLSERRD